MSHLSTNRFTLLIASVAATALWLLQSGATVDSLLGWGVAAVAVYVAAEVNNAFSLLRVNSRMVSATLAILLGVCQLLHPLQLAHASLLMSLMLLIPLFAAYQQTQSPAMSFCAMTIVTLPALWMPQLLIGVPMVWMAQVVLRQFSLRNLVAGLLGVVNTVWLWAVVVVLTDQSHLFMERWISLTIISPPDWFQITFPMWLQWSYVLFVFVCGTVHFIPSRQQEKTRVRAFYHVFLIFGVIAFTLAVLQPHDFHVYFSLTLVPTSVLAAHWLTLSRSRLTSWLFSLLIVLAGAVIVQPLFIP